jgi:diaminohydroxyphosphoribosylaminopyrimidine deaminase/5-amino-6-(5-phosphoribosylamino)uracil reductase
MRIAIKKASAARPTVKSRPWVGAVLIPENADKDAWITANTDGEFGDHAEVCAIKKAKDLVRNSTLVVTLEPCCHQGTTGACTSEIIKAGIKRVFVGTTDPDNRVQKKGINALIQAGVDVIYPVLEKEVEENLEPYLYQRRTGLTYCVLKLAATLDGFLAFGDYSSKWITSEAARKDAQILRSHSQAIIVGKTTFEKDNPSLSCSIANRNWDPLKVVLGEPNNLRDDIIVKKGEPKDILTELASMGVVQALVEGGGNVAYKFLESGLVNKYVFYYGTKLLGGNNGTHMFEGKGAPSLGSALELKIANLTMLGNDIKLELIPKRKHGS